jgi:hypothetical protein
LRKNLIYIPQVDGPNPTVALPPAEQALRVPLIVFVNSRSGGQVGLYCFSVLGFFVSSCYFFRNIVRFLYK